MGLLGKLFPRKSTQKGMGALCGKQELAFQEVEPDAVMELCKTGAAADTEAAAVISVPQPGNASSKTKIEPEATAGPPVPAPIQPSTQARPSTGSALTPKTPSPASKLRKDCKVKDAYKLGKTLGTGGFAIVKLAVEKESGAEFACKIMALPGAGETPGENENTREDIFKEIDILCGMNHENVVYLKEYFEEGNKVYLITELVTGGELLDAVLQRGTYSETEARSCFMQLLSGIEYLHSKNVVHRDLKLENLLLASPDDITKVKIADFGLAKKAIEAMSTVCGTPQYVAPEVIQGIPGLEYGPGVDMWSAGVVLYILLGGYPPFWSESEPALFEQIRKGQFNFDDPVWTNVSNSAKDLIRQLLDTDPTRRLTAKDALAHPWLTSTLPSSRLTATQQNLSALRL